MKSWVFSSLLKVGREGARYSSIRSWFQIVGATVKKAQIVVDAFLASFIMATQRSIAWEDLVAWVDDLGERCCDM